MSLSQRITRFALQHVADPWQAAALADNLDEIATTRGVAAAMPPTWVLAKQKGNIEGAVFAVTHCTDPDTLDAIAKTARRKGVLHALSHSPYLSDAGAELLTARAAEMGDRQIPINLSYRLGSSPVEEIPTTPDERFVEFMDSMAACPEDWANTWTVLSELSDVEKPLSTPRADAVLDAMTAAGQWWGVARLLRARLRPEAEQALDESFCAASYTVLECLDKLSPNDQFDALLDFLSVLGDPTATPLDLALTKRLVATVTMSDAWRPLLSNINGTKAFDDESVEYLLAHRRWRQALIMHELTLEQLETLATTLDSDHIPLLLGRYHLTRAELEIILPKVTPNSLDRDTLSIEHALSYITGSDDPLLADYIRAVPEPIRVDYLRGDWLKRTIPLLPSLDELAAAIDDDPSQFHLSVCFYDEYPEHMALMLDRIPGFAWHNVEYATEGAHIFTRLAATEAPLDFALSQFDANGANTTLDHLCDTLARFTTLSA